MSFLKLIIICFIFSFCNKRGTHKVKWVEYAIDKSGTEGIGVVKKVEEFSFKGRIIAEIFYDTLEATPIQKRFNYNNDGKEISRIFQFGNIITNTILAYDANGNVIASQGYSNNSRDTVILSFQNTYNLDKLLTFSLITNPVGNIDTLYIAYKYDKAKRVIETQTGVIYRGTLKPDLIKTNKYDSSGHLIKRSELGLKDSLLKETIFSFKENLLIEESYWEQNISIYSMYYFYRNAKRDYALKKYIATGKKSKIVFEYLD
jgi:hypothetical protein